MEEISMDGIQIVQSIEAVPKPVLHCDNSSNTVVPYTCLSGEGGKYLDCTMDGIIVLSNYRMYLSEDAIYNIPLGLIEQVEIRDIFYLHIHCKDARSFRFIFSNYDDCQKWYKRLSIAISPPEKVDDHFCFAFYLWSKYEHKDYLFSQLHQGNAFDIHSEAERMGFDLRSVWRITKINEDYTFCPSYPKHILVPALIYDDVLESVAKFRFSKRIPSVVWRHQQNGCVIARCSQPKVGWFGWYGWRNQEDENLIQAILDSCMSDLGFELRNGAREECVSLKSDLDGEVSVYLHDQGEDSGISKSKLLIIDARSYAAAVANRAKGGGCECPEYYPNCEIQFLSLANIHSIRKSFTNMRTLCATASEQQNWWSSLESTNWLQHIAGLLRAALLLVNAVDVERRPVLVHCSDGWDRTPQIVALAELMMDPYYRSRKGFQVLVEKEWLEFGHKFADRCGHSCGVDDPNERSPVFLQWLDCVHQLLQQFPCHFEFNQQYLIKLVQHTYSCLFGTFLCNTDQERTTYKIQLSTFSVWPFLNSNDCFHNYLFNNSSQVLRPSCHAKDIKLWEEVYLPTYSSTLGKSTVPPEPEVVPEEMCHESTTLVKTKSCDNISSINHSSRWQRRNSESNIVESASTYSDGHINQLQPNGSICSEQINTLSTRVSSNSCKNNYLTDANSNLFEKTNIKHNLPERTKSAPSEINSNSSLMLNDVMNDVSTDTLVSENGITVTEPTKDNVEVPDAHKDLLLNGTLRRSVSTSTSKISESSVVPISLLNGVKNGNVDGKWSLCQSVLDAYVSSKKSTFSSGSRSYSTPHHSRTPSSGFPATPCDDHPNDSYRSRAVLHQTLDLDGLNMTRDEVQEQVHKLVWNFKTKLVSLEGELWAAQNNSPQVCSNCRGKDLNCVDNLDDAASLADSTCSGEQRVDSSAGSDGSWESVDHPAVRTLWVPDHAVSHCMRCDAEFWTGLRKHHCRKCGGIFCSVCSSQVMPVPTEQLFDPVRVCCSCFEVFQTQCRQAAVSCDKLPKPIVTAAST